MAGKTLTRWEIALGMAAILGTVATFIQAWPVIQPLFTNPDPVKVESKEAGQPFPMPPQVSSYQPKSYLVCYGDSEPGCGAHDLYLACGGDREKLAAEFCTHPPQIGDNFNITGDGSCGSAQFYIKC